MFGTCREFSALRATNSGFQEIFALLSHRLLFPGTNVHQYCTIRMAEAVGLASGLLTLTVSAYKTSKSLYEAVSSFKSQRKTIKDIQADLNSLVTVLGKINEQIQSSQDVESLESLRQPVSCCDLTCNEMHKMLDACTTHAKDGRDSVRDWLSMRYHEKSFEDMKQRLASYKSTPSIAFELVMM